MKDKRCEHLRVASSHRGAETRVPRALFQGLVTLMPLVWMVLTGMASCNPHPPANAVIYRVTSVQLNPTTVVGGQQNSSGTVTISAAAASPSGNNVTLSSNNASVSVPATVNVPAGSTTGTFTATTRAVTAATQVTISASIGITSPQTATLEVNPPAANPPVLSITKTHTGDFTQGQQNATYTVTVSNGANAGPTDGSTVTVTETVPSGLTLVSMTSNGGWTCPGAGGATTCDRSDVLNAGASFPTITVTVNVGASASSPQVNQVGVSGGGSVSNNYSDSTVINAKVSGPTSLLVSENQANTGGGSTVGSTSVASHDGRFVAFTAEGSDISPTSNPNPPNVLQVFLRDTCSGATAPANCAPSTTMISTTGAPGGSTAGNGNSGLYDYGEHAIAISPDGRFVAFNSSATNLTSDFVGTGGAVFLSDTCLSPNSTVPNCTPSTVLVTKNHFGVDTGYDPSISNGGRYVGFIATGRLEGNPSAGYVYYILDTCTNNGQQVSACTEAWTPIPINGTGSGVCGVTAFVCSSTPAISADGRYVVFGAAGAITNTPGGDIYLYDTCLQPNAPVSGCTPQTLLVSSPDGVTHSDNNSDFAVVSEDGQFVAFTSSASNLVTPAVSKSCSTSQGGTQTCQNVFVRLTCIGASSPSGCTPQTFLVSEDASGGSTVTGSFNPSVSGDGQFIAFFSGSTNLTNPASSGNQIFVRNMCLNNTTAGPIAGCTVQTKVATLDPNGNPGNAASGFPAVGLDGTALSLASSATNFVMGTTGNQQIYLFPMPQFP